MLQTRKRLFPAVALAALLLLGPAVTTSAAPIAGETATWGWLTNAYESAYESIARWLAANGAEAEAGGSMDPDGAEAGPDMDPNGAEAGPDMDPNGAEAGPDMDPNG